MSSESLANPAHEIPPHHIPLPQDSQDSLHPPLAPGFVDDPANRSSYGAPSNQSFNSAQPFSNLGAQQPRETSTLLADKEDYGGEAGASQAPLDLQAGSGKKRRWPLYTAIAVLAVVIIAVAVAVPVSLTKKKSGNGSSASSDNGGSSSSGSGNSGGGSSSGGSSGPTTPSGTVSGGFGSLITTDTGATFTYQNNFGGVWYQDPNDPFNNNAQAQSWSKPLNQTWEWGVDIVRGVNLGGWLVPEPFIVPALFEPYQNTSIVARDEWTLSQAMAADTANGGLTQLENHYKTFITEEDFARIASAGLNWVRLPIPFWAISKLPDEPFLEGVAWQYALKAFAWARKYGIRVNIDLHTMPGSQNGYNHSGKGGQVNFLYGVMGLANAERGLDYIRIITEFISQPEYANVVPYFGVVNEALVKSIGMDVMGSFYLKVHETVRNITGVGAGHGPYISIHDGFESISTWADFLPGKDRVALDSHPYMCFSDPDPSPLAQQVTRPCDQWANSFNTSWDAFGVTTAGEWSLAWNDCGYWVNGVNAGSRWAGTLSSYGGASGGDPNGCDDWNDWQNWTQATKDDLKNMALASMDALQNYFFWTWRIGNSSILGTVGAPFWSYSLGLEQGWMPTDPRAAVGVCGGGSPVDALSPSQTGGAGSGDFSASVISGNPWPPTTFAPGGWSGTELPTYTQTGTPIPTLPMPTFTGAAAAQVTGNGWFDAQDTVPVWTPISGCTYPDGWDAVDVSVPPACN